MNITNFRLPVIGLMVLAFAVGSVSAQKKNSKKPATKKPPVTTKTVPPLEVRAGREKVDAQLANVNRFVDVLGPIAQAIETLDESAKKKPLSDAAAAKNMANKRNVISAIGNLRVGLSVLESEFRTKPALQKYLLQIQGITDLAAQSEDAAIDGKFVMAKEPLRAISKKLTDTLTAMPL